MSYATIFTPCLRCLPCYNWAIFGYQTHKRLCKVSYLISFFCWFCVAIFCSCISNAYFHSGVFLLIKWFWRSLISSFSIYETGFSLRVHTSMRWNFHSLCFFNGYITCSAFSFIFNYKRRGLFAILFWKSFILLYLIFMYLVNYLAITATLWRDVLLLYEASKKRVLLHGRLNDGIFLNKSMLVWLFRWLYDPLLKLVFYEPYQLLLVGHFRAHYWYAVSEYGDKFRRRQQR